MTGFFPRLGGWIACLLALGVLAACSSRSLNRAPVEDRGIPPTKIDVESRAATADKPLLPAVDVTGKSVFYTVKPKDTLIAIGLETGQSPRDIARWNNLDNPNRIEIGQVLRIAPPGSEAESVAVAKPVASGAVVASPIAAGQTRPVTPGVPQVVASGTEPASAPVTGTTAAPPDDEMGWIWPARGPVLAGFDEAKNKGLDIGGAAGDAVLASADGKVVYAGAGLRGYGNLIILKHNNVYLTAYAHNQALLVKEDQAVKRGQKIAEMGNSDADRVKLHFEVRRQGKPVDPGKYMPPR